MVAMPWVIARAGTGRPAEKKRALSARVRSLSATTRVMLSNGEPGSLKAMWPLDPMPSSCSPTDASRTSLS